MAQAKQNINIIEEDDEKTCYMKTEYNEKLGGIITDKTSMRSPSSKQQQRDYLKIPFSINRLDISEIKK